MPVELVFVATSEQVRQSLTRCASALNRAMTWNKRLKYHGSRARNSTRGELCIRI
jgi:hypothetical protein